MTINEIELNETAYPEHLKTIHNPPQRLRVNGALCKRDKTAVALVGSRRASKYGLEVCERLAYSLAVAGITVVSGMARGIDTAAHRGALKARGRTIAVLGSGHHNIYPPENRALYKEIAKSAAVVSEFDDDVPPLRQNFPKRNRIISGLSLGVVVVEASQTSGSLITANFALEQGREVFAVPGKVDSKTSRGTHELIRDGALLVQSAEDILQELRIQARGADAPIAAPFPHVDMLLNDAEKRVITTLSDEPLYLDEILNQTGLPHRELTKALLALELKKSVRVLPGKYYVLNG